MNRVGDTHLVFHLKLAYDTILVERVYCHGTETNFLLLAVIQA